VELRHIPSKLLFQVTLSLLLEFSLIAIGIGSNMKTNFVIPLFAGFVAAHSGVWNVEVDGNMYDHFNYKFHNFMLTLIPQVPCP
jgi:hypothetical protein